MKWFKYLLSENGSVSCIRVMSLICCLTACYISIKGGDIAAITSLLGSAFAGKVSQKLVELKHGQSQEVGSSEESN